MYFLSNVWISYRKSVIDMDMEYEIFARCNLSLAFTCLGGVLLKTEVTGLKLFYWKTCFMSQLLYDIIVRNIS